MTTITRPRRLGARGMLLLLLGAALVIRLVLAATTDGNSFDLRSFELVANVLSGGDPFSLYSHVRVENWAFDVSRWPYPPGYHPAVLVSDAFASVTGVPFGRVIRGPAIVADLALAAVLFWALRRTRGDRIALAAAATVAFGPSFLANSGAHGQLDSAAVLPAVVAIVLWERGIDRRWLWCGLLIGAGAAINTPMGILLLALLPTAVGYREMLRTAATAVAVPFVLLVPFLIATPRETIEGLSYAGLPGIGGFSLVVQPDLALSWLAGQPLGLTDASEALRAIAPIVTLACVGAAALLLFRARVAAAPAAVVLVLVLWVTGMNFALGYAVWGLPLLLLCGRLRLVWAFQALLVVPILMVYARPDAGWSETTVRLVFVPCMIAFLLAAIAVLVRDLRVLTRAPARVAASPRAATAPTGTVAP